LRYSSAFFRWTGWENNDGIVDVVEVMEVVKVEVVASKCSLCSVREAVARRKDLAEKDLSR
jgi:hypothetical protein